MYRGTRLLRKSLNVNTKKLAHIMEFSPHRTTASSRRTP